MMLLGIILIICPIFIIVALRTKLLQKQWVKIVITILSGLFLYCLVNTGVLQNKIDEQDELIVTMHKMNYNYYNCINDAVKIDSQKDFYECVSDHNDMIYDIYSK